jgi:hypothetical protein
MMKKIGADLHSLIGTSGLVATVTLKDVNAFIASLVGMATLAYMIFRAAREWRKWKNGK